VPILESSSYRSPFWIPNGHIETIVQGVFRTMQGIHYQRERLITSDGDFLDMDWSRVGAKRLVVVSHGLEGNSERAYVKGFVHLFNANHWDALAWNCRSCSGVMNLTEKLYHHGASYDLDAVIKHALTFGYDEIYLLGVSMGGSLSLRWLGENANSGMDEVVGAAVFSVPCSLPDSVLAIEKGANRIYERRFIRKLKKKVLIKAEQFPHLVDLKLAKSAKNFRQLDSAYSINVYGFRQVDDFYEHISALPFISKITKPVLIANALNDPMLIGDCYPKSIAKTSSNVFLEMPEFGGHAAFKLRKSPYSWAELRALAFYESHLAKK
jgi:uncharacterized protein